MKNIDNEKLNKILLGIIIALQIMTISIVVLCSDCYKKDEQESKENEISLVEKNESLEEEITTKDESTNKVRVDVKGAVKKTGVYELDSGARVIDAINLAGGLKSSASTKYLNLSKKVTDEMVIYVYTTTQIKNMNVSESVKEECSCSLIDCSSCAGANIILSDSNSNVSDSTSSEVSNGKVSINNGTKEELMTLSGIGESKALAIIEYRTSNGGFTNLEDIMNVSGIGESAYSKIKDYITL